MWQKSNLFSLDLVKTKCQFLYFLVVSFLIVSCSPLTFSRDVVMFDELQCCCQVWSVYIYIYFIYIYIYTLYIYIHIYIYIYILVLTFTSWEWKMCVVTLMKFPVHSTNFERNVKTHVVMFDELQCCSQVWSVYI